MDNEYNEMNDAFANEANEAADQVEGTAAEAEETAAEAAQTYQTEPEKDLEIAVEPQKEAAQPKVPPQWTAERGEFPHPTASALQNGNPAYARRFDPMTGRPLAQPQEPVNPGVHTYVNSSSAYTGNRQYGAPDRTANTTPIAPEKKKKKEGGGVKKAVALMAALCIVLSAVFGGVGVYVGSRIANNGVQTDAGKSASSDPNGTINYVTGENAVNPDGSISAAAAIASDSVVEISTEKVSTSIFYGQYVQSGAGSGVIISEDGYILTCAHVVEGATSVTVRLTNKDDFQAKVVGSDTRTDIAVLKIDATGLVAAKVGDSDKVVVGQNAIAIGNPLGTLGGTVTSGIISSLGREITIDGQTYTLMQLDASINPGNSGGGLFDINGNLIGIVNAKSGGSDNETTIEGLGFAIPINQAIEVAKQLSENGYVAGRAAFGVYVLEVNQSTTTSELYQNGYSDLINYINGEGVYFLKYRSGQNGDFQYGDKIIAVNGTSVSSRADISSVLEDYSIGDTVTVTVSRLNSDKRRAQFVEIKVNLVESVPDTQTDSDTVTTD